MYNGINITKYMRNNRFYDGNTEKLGVQIDNTNYIIKAAKKSETSLYSEHLASRFIRNIGINCHETWLGLYETQPVVILKDFTSRNHKLRSYKDIRQSSEATVISGKTYTYKDIMYLIDQQPKLSDSNKQRIIHQFWQMFICDAILGNRDRHHGNWGFLITKNGYLPAPIYDNGASLFPDIYKRIDEYKHVLESNNEFKFIADRSEKFPASLFQMQRANGEIKRTNYNEVLSDLRINKTLAKEVKVIKEKVGFNRIYESILRPVAEVKDFIPYEYRRFYIIIVCTRYLHIVERKTIEDAYAKAVVQLERETRQW